MNLRNISTVLVGKVFDVEQFDVEICKGWHTFQVIRHPGGVAVLPLHTDGTVTLIRQPRPAVGISLLELPAGRLDPDEPPENCGRRELLEETGLVAADFHPVGIIHSSPGVFDEVIHLYVATGLTQNSPAPEADEDIEPVRIPVREALHMARDGRITDGKTIAALFRGAPFYDSFRPY
jgi:ADP-ribose pyrophosphatase